MGLHLGEHDGDAVFRKKRLLKIKLPVPPHMDVHIDHQKAHRHGHVENGEGGNPVSYERRYGRNENVDEEGKTLTGPELPSVAENQRCNKYNQHHAGNLAEEIIRTAHEIAGSVVIGNRVVEQGKRPAEDTGYGQHPGDGEGPVLRFRIPVHHDVDIGGEQAEDHPVSKVSDDGHDILQGLKNLTVPGSDELIIPKINEYRVYDAPASDGLLGEYTAQPKTNVYDKMMERYTGRGAVNGTSEKMKKAFAKALTAYMLKLENPDAPLNKKNAEKMFKTINRELRIAEMTDEQLRESLQSPEVFSEAIIKQRSRVYAPDNEAAYKSYIKDMRSIYKIMMPKSKGNIWYNKAYDCIEKLAHLPEDLDGVDKNKAFRLVEKLNQELVSYSRERMILKPGIYLDQEFRELFMAMHSLVDNCTGTTGLVNDLLEKYNTLRGAKRAPNGRFYIGDQVYFDFDHYDSERLKHIVDVIPEKDHRRKLDKSIERKMFDEVKPFNQKEIRKDMKKTKADAEKTVGKKFKDEPVKSSEKHVEPKKPRHNSMI